MGTKAQLIRELAADDLGTLAVLEQECFADAWNLSMLESETGNQFATYLVLQVEDKVVGYAGVWLVAGEAEIHRVVVAEKFRGLGYGKLLTESLVKQCFAQGATQVSLEVREDNVPALKTYLSVGFQKVGVRKNYYGQGKNAIIMRNA